MMYRSPVSAQRGSWSNLRRVSVSARLSEGVARSAHSGRSLMKPNLVRSRTKRPFSSSRISSASSVSSALFVPDQHPELAGRGKETNTKLELSSSSTRPPMSARTSSIVFRGPGLERRYRTTFLRSGAYARAMWSTDFGRLCCADVLPHASAMMSLPNERRSSCCFPLLSVEVPTPARTGADLVSARDGPVEREDVEHGAPADPHAVLTRHDDAVRLKASNSEA